MSTFSAVFPSIIIRAVISAVLLACGIALLTYTKRRRQQQEKAAGASVCSAQVADLRITQSAGAYITEMALIYTGADGMSHRAFLSVRNHTPLNVQIGTILPVAVFPAPLTAAPPQAYDPMRGADGRLPDRVMPVSFNGIPLDETGSVMLSADYPRWQIQAAHGGRGTWIAGIILTVLGGIRLLTLLYLFLF